MNFQDADSGPIESPCVDICTHDHNDICIGCGRHTDEVIAWPTAERDAKRRILAAAAERLEQMAAARRANAGQG